MYRATNKTATYLENSPMATKIVGKTVMERPPVSFSGRNLASGGDLTYRSSATPSSRTPGMQCTSAFCMEITSFITESRKATITDLYALRVK